MDDDCPLFLIYKGNFNCLHDNCKYYDNGKCVFEEVKKVVYQKLASERLKRHPDEGSEKELVT